jgi:hypothetical protein
MSYVDGRSGDFIQLPSTLQLAAISSATFSFGESFQFPFLKGIPMSQFTFWFRVEGSYDPAGKSFYIKNSIANVVVHLECE